MKPYYQDGSVTIYHGDCREIMPTIKGVDLVLTDPPYGKVKGDFDHEWTNRPAMLEDCKVWLDGMVGTMKPNATLYWFAWPSLAGRIEHLISERLNPLAHIVWKKPTSMALRSCPDNLRAPFPETERILMAEHYGADCNALDQSGYKTQCNAAAVEVFGKYITETRKKHRITMKHLTESVGAYGKINHGGACSNWENGYNIPTKEQYGKIQRDFTGCFSKPYEELRKEYEELRRYFDMRTGDQKTDVWEFAPNTEKLGHPTQKPLPLMSYIVRLSCRPSGLVLDPFAGSGTTLRAAKNLGRVAIGIEKEEKYCEIAARRMAQECFAFQ